MSVRKRSNGYGYRFSYRDASGNRIWCQRDGFPTKREAEAAERQHHAKVDAARSVISGRTTTADYLTAWFDRYERSGSRKPTTVDSTRLHLERYVLPRIGTVPLADLSPTVVSRLLADLLTDGRTGRNGTGGLSPKTVRNIAGTLNKALRDGVKRGELDRNPAEHVDLPKVQRQPLHVWDSDTIRLFLAHLNTTREPGDADATGWHLMFATGMRRGEVLGLRWENVDLVAGLLRVITTRVVTRAGVIDSDPKSAAGRRTIQLDRHTVDALARLRDRQENDAATLGVTPPVYVIAGPDGRPTHPSTFLNRLHREVRRAGLPDLNLHRIRHTAVTWALEHGLDIHVVSRRAGHSRVSTTLDMYAGVVPTADHLAAEKIAAMFDGPKWSPDGHRKPEMVTEMPISVDNSRNG